MMGSFPRKFHVGGYREEEAGLLRQNGGVSAQGDETARLATRVSRPGVDHTLLCHNQIHTLVGCLGG